MTEDELAATLLVEPVYTADEKIVRAWVLKHRERFLRSNMTAIRAARIAIHTKKFEKKAVFSILSHWDTVLAMRHIDGVANYEVHLREQAIARVQQMREEMERKERVKKCLDLSAQWNDLYKYNFEGIDLK